MSLPLFSNRAQIYQLVVQVIACIITGIVAWPSLAALNVLSIAPLIFFGVILCLIIFLLRAIVRWKKTLDTTNDLGGIAHVHMTWAGMDNDEWIREQAELYIFLKDGKRFFEERHKALTEKCDDVLYDRLTDSKKTTHILIVHPQYRHIDAVATMDPIKAKDPDIQIDECLMAIRTMQEMATEARSRGMDITKRNTFSGYHLIPTYNAMFGDDKGHVNFYYSRPYRGNLISLECNKLDHGSIYSEFKNDFKEILRDRNTTSLWHFDARKALNRLRGNLTEQGKL